MVSIDKEKCIGCGLCTKLCSEVFEMQGDGKASVKEDKDIPCVKDSIASCPVSAINEDKEK